MRWIASFASVLAVMLALLPNQPWAAESGRPPKIERAAPQQSAATDQRGTNYSPLVVKVLPTQKTEAEAAQDAAERQEKAESDAWIIRLTGALVTVGALQLLVFGWQGWQLRRTVTAMREIADGQTADMQSYINAASRSAVAMEAVAHDIGKNVETTTGMATTQRDFWGRQMRAYVLPDNASIWDGMTLDVPQPGRKGVPGVVLVIRNSGATPAYSVVSWAAIDVVDTRNEGTLSAPLLQPQFSNTLAPQGTFTKALWFHRPLTDHEISDIATGIRGIYVYGRIEYRDVLEKERYSNFRVRYSGVYPAAKGSFFNFSEAGNDAD